MLPVLIPMVAGQITKPKPWLTPIVKSPKAMKPTILISKTLFLFINMNRWEIRFLGLLAILIIGANVATGYFLFKRKTIEPKVSLPPTPTLVPSPLPTVDETNLIKQAVFAKTGLDETKAEVSIGQNTGKHAKGNIRELEAVGGAYWLAAKSAESADWICVYDGQANPSCSQIAPYNFPKDMVPECLDASGKVVKR